MIPRISRDLCTGCWECVEACPTAALIPAETPRVAAPLCVSCGACVPVCAPGAVSFPQRVSI